MTWEQGGISGVSPPDPASRPTAGQQGAPVTFEVIFQISGPPDLETLLDNCPR